MKTQSRRGRRRFQLEVLYYGNSYYTERIAQLETALSRKPRTLHIDMLGAGEPFKELAGRLIGVPVLRQFGLVENEKMDHFLATVFSKSSEPVEGPLNATGEKRVQRR